MTEQHREAAWYANLTRWRDKPTDEAIREECEHYAAMGYSRTVAAHAIGYTRPHFTRHVLPRIDPHGEIPWPSRGWSVAHQQAMEEAA